MFPPLDIPYENWLEHGTFGRLDVMSRFSTRIFYRGVLGFATEYPYGLWGHGLTTCLLYVGPFFKSISLAIYQNTAIFISINAQASHGGNACLRCCDIF